MYARDGRDMHPKKIDIFGVHIFMSRKQKNYSPEFKIRVIMDMRAHRLGYCEGISFTCP